MNELEFAESAPHFREVIMAQCARMGIAQEDAEDIAQEVLIKLWRIHDTLGSGSSHEALARTVARRLALNALRRSKTVSIEVLNIDYQGEADGRYDVEEQEEASRLMARIKALPASQGSILYLRHVEEMSKKEIAGILGIKETSVNTLLGRARKNLMNGIKRNKK